MLLASEPVLGTPAARQDPGDESTEQHNPNCHRLHIHRRCQSSLSEAQEHPKTFAAGLMRSWEADVSDHKSCFTMNSSGEMAALQTNSNKA